MKIGALKGSLGVNDRKKERIKERKKEEDAEM